MEWIFQGLAIVFENTDTVFMKLSNGLTRVGPSILIWVCYIPSFLMLSLALRKIDVGTGYAIWSGVSTATIALIGILFFNEPVNEIKIISIGLIILGVIGLNLGGGH